LKIDAKIKRKMSRKAEKHLQTLKESVSGIAVETSF